MIVKDVDMDQNGNKTYVFGTDERYQDLLDFAKLYLDHYVNYNITNHYQSDGDFTGMLARKAREAIAKYKEGI